MLSSDNAANLAEAVLVRAAQNGDSQAFEALVELHGPRLYHLLLRLGGNAEVANDLMQEVLLHVWQRLDRFAGQSAFATWLWSVGRNRALDILRKRAPRPMADEHLQAVPAPTAHNPLEQQERQQLLHWGLDRLNAEAREIIILRDFQGHDYPHIATILDIAEGTVKSRLSRARAALREILNPYLKAEDLP